MTHFKKQPPEVFYKKAILKNLQHSLQKIPVLESLYNKVAGLKACSAIKKRLQHRCFPVNIAKRLLLPLEVFYIRNLLILALRMFHLAY